MTGECETGYPGRPPSFRRTRGLEPTPAGENDRLPTADFSTSLRERREVRPTHPERGAAEQVQARFGRPDAGAAGRAGRCVRDIETPARVGPERAARWDREAVRDVGVDLPVMPADAGRHAGEEVVEGDDAVERCLRKQRLERDYGAPADPEVHVATPIQLEPERWAVGRAGGWAGGPAPLRGAERRVCRKHHEEQRAADALLHVDASRCLL